MLSLLCAYSFFLPFSFAFAITPVLSIPVIISCLLFGLCIAQLRLLSVEDILLPVLIVLIAILSFLLNAEHLEVQKSVNHIAAVAYVFLALYPSLLIAIRSVVGDPCKRETLGIWIAGGIAFSSVVSMWQFTALNVLHIPLPDMPSLIGAEPYRALVTVSGVLLQRARSLTRESGNFAMYLMVVLPIYIACGRTPRPGVHMRHLVGALAIGGWLTTFSVSAIFAACACFVVYLYKAFWLQGVAISQKRVVALCLALASVCFVAGSASYSIVDSKLNSFSFDNRAERVVNNTNVWSNAGVSELLFGLGPGYYAGYGVDPVIGFYVLILTQWGFAGAIVFCIFLYNHISPLLKSSDQASLCLALSLTAMLVFFVSSSNYYFPWVAYGLAVARALGKVGDGSSLVRRTSLAAPVA